MVELFNCIVSNEQFLGIWKIAHINPLHKKFSRMNVEKYRSISKLTALALLVERVLYNKIKRFIQRTLCKNQHGFKKHHLTVTNILLYCDFVQKKLEQGELSLTLFLVFAKAFDSISQNINLCKLAKKGFDHKFLHLLHLISHTENIVFLCSTLSHSALKQLVVYRDCFLQSSCFHYI